MVYELTNEEKLGIVEQHLKNLTYSKFNIEVSLIEESSVNPIKEDIIDNLQNQITDISAKIAALLEEINLIN